MKGVHGTRSRGRTPRNRLVISPLGHAEIDGPLTPIPRPPRDQQPPSLGVGTDRDENCLNEQTRPIPCS